MNTRHIFSIALAFAASLALAPADDHTVFGAENGAIKLD